MCVFSESASDEADLANISYILNFETITKDL